MADETSVQPTVGKPYQVAGRWYEPKEDPDYDRQGVASWYGRRFHGRRTANGEFFDRAALSAAHPTLPLPSYVRVTNLENERSVVVRVNDRGPFSRNRLIDVSEQTADLLGFKRAGMAPVRVQYVAPAKTDGGDQAFLLASYQGPASSAVSRSVMLASAPTELPPPRRKAPRQPVQLAVVSGPAELAGRSANQVAFVSEATAPERRVNDAVGALSGEYPADARISMTFDLLSAPVE